MSAGRFTRLGKDHGSGGVILFLLRYLPDKLPDKSSHRCEHCIREEFPKMPTPVRVLSITCGLLPVFAAHCRLNVCGFTVE